MYRTALDKLYKWKEKKNRKPLIIEGARQVGKTWLMKEFGRQYLKKTAYISFYNNKRMANVFEDDFDIERIIMSINVETKMEVTPEDTLIIFDEIQEAPRALEALKYFCENAPQFYSLFKSLLASQLQKSTTPSQPMPVARATADRPYSSMKK